MALGKVITNRFVEREHNLYFSSNAIAHKLGFERPDNLANSQTQKQINTVAIHTIA